MYGECNLVFCPSRLTILKADGTVHGGIATLRLKNLRNKLAKLGGDFFALQKYVILVNIYFSPLRFILTEACQKSRKFRSLGGKLPPNDPPTLHHHHQKTL
jgi:hypothetical protein